MVASNFLVNLTNTKSISNKHKILCDNPITLNEVKSAIHRLKVNKCPGVDG